MFSPRRVDVSPCGRDGRERFQGALRMMSPRSRDGCTHAGITPDADARASSLASRRGACARRSLHQRGQRHSLLRISPRLRPCHFYSSAQPGRPARHRPGGLDYWSSYSTATGDFCSMDAYSRAREYKSRAGTDSRARAARVHGITKGCRSLRRPTNAQKLRLAAALSSSSLSRTALRRRRSAHLTV